MLLTANMICHVSAALEVLHPIMWQDLPMAKLRLCNIYIEYNQPTSDRKPLLQT